MAAPKLSTLPLLLNLFAPTAHINHGKYPGDDTGKHTRTGRKWEFPLRS
jgi:hypothetical protein